MGRSSSGGDTASGDKGLAWLSLLALLVPTMCNESALVLDCCQGDSVTAVAVSIEQTLASECSPWGTLCGLF